MWNRLKIQEGCLRSEEGVPAPHQGPQLRVPVLGSQVPTTSGCENHWGLIGGGSCQSPKQFLSGNLYMDPPTQTPSI